jgi:hypothetical protein
MRWLLMVLFGDAAPRRYLSQREERLDLIRCLDDLNFILNYIFSVFSENKKHPSQKNLDTLRGPILKTHGI